MVASLENVPLESLDHFCEASLTHQWIEKDAGTGQAFRFDSYRICLPGGSLGGDRFEYTDVKMVQRKVHLGFSRAKTT